MTKVAIMTWYHYPNFGTALQVTALSYIIKKMGYQPEVIQYIPTGKVVKQGDYANLSFVLKEVKSKFDNFNIIKEKQRDIAFYTFLKNNIKLTQPCQTASRLFSLNDEFDAFICGSDQIWAPSVFDSKYFLDFVKDPSKMIAYAPSIGLYMIDDLYVRRRMKENITRFKHLSIREEHGKSLIKELTGKDAEVVLDPTLLLTSEEWDSMTKMQEESEPYILCYFLGNNKLPWKHVKILSKKLGFPVRIIPIFKQDLRRKYQTILGVGPAEFLKLIKNAAFVCTDSLHGTIFSIIYEKPFYVYPRFSDRDKNSQNSRIYHILKITGLEDRLIKNKLEIKDSPMECNFEEVRYRLEIEKQKSFQYLENALKEAVSSSLIDNYTITNTCTGCGACAAVCKYKAIEIKRDENGFLKAFINQDKCIRCSICEKVCPFNGRLSTKIDKEKQELFMTYSKNFEVLKKSSSGGIAYEISKLLSEHGYDVIGCNYDKERAEAVHRRVSAKAIDELNIFQGSKYLQSNIAEVVKELTNNSKKTVIFGTPCQISGIDRLLKFKKKRNDYILIDLICHGVPSQNLWKKYLKEGSKKYDYGLNPEVIFRYKPKGWRKMYIRISGNGKTYLQVDKKDLFYRFFLLGHCFSPACYECNYRIASAADIRIGDYWGPRFKNNKNGVSMVITLTQIGRDLLQELYSLNRIELQKMNCEEYWTVQYPQNPIKPVFYEELLQELRDDSIALEAIADKYCKEFEWYQKLYLVYDRIKRIYKKMKEHVR